MQPEDMKVCIAGLGYIGLPTAALLASRGVHVHGVDTQESIVEAINRHEVPIVEPHLDTLLRAVCESGHLHASLEPAEADVFIIAVPTPTAQDAEKGYPVPCIDHVLEATRQLALHVRPGNLILLESTSPVGTTDRVAQTLADAGVNLDDVHLAYCPERVLPGRIILELVENDRIIGGYTPAASRVAREFYRIFVTGKIHETNARTAEMAKLTENASRDVNIALANELSMICQQLEIDVQELIALANCHPRVNILSPGCGVGGHCIAVDPWFIVDSAPEEARIIRTAREVNDYKRLWVLERIKAEYRKLNKDTPVIAILGLSFKPNIDDVRSSPALFIAQALLKEEDAKFLLVDPHVKAQANLPLTPLEEALAQADMVVKLVNHSAFQDIDVHTLSTPLLNFAS